MGGFENIAPTTGSLWTEMRLKRFEIRYRDGSRAIARAKSRRTLEKRLSRDTLQNALIRQIKRGSGGT
jgi:hypothetical protein